MNPGKAPTSPQMASMRCREAFTRLPNGSQMAQMKPQDAPWSSLGDIGEACVFLLPRGVLAEHVPNRYLCVLHRFCNLCWSSLQTLTLTFKISCPRNVGFTQVYVFLSSPSNTDLDIQYIMPSNCWFYTGFISFVELSLTLTLNMSCPQPVGCTPVLYA